MAVDDDIQPYGRYAIYLSRMSSLEMPGIKSMESNVQSKPLRSQKARHVDVGSPSTNFV